MNFGYIAKFTSNQDLIGLENCLQMKGIPVDDGDLSKVHMLALFGGEDISPSLYGQKPVGTSASRIPSYRDAIERAVFTAAVEDELPILGICRGAQLACALLGGKLWQDVDKHEGVEHTVVVRDKKYITNSYHHQMMIPTGEMQVLGYTPCRSPVKTGEKPVKDEGDEAEIVFDPKYRVLMIQGHPEWCTEDHDLFKLTYSLVRELLCSRQS